MQQHSRFPLNAQLGGAWVCAEWASWSTCVVTEDLVVTGTFIDFALLSRAAPETRKVKAGDVIFSAGDAGHEFYVIRTGKVAIATWQSDPQRPR